VTLDSSAILAILFREPGFNTFVEKLASAPTAGIGVQTLAKKGVLLSARRTLVCGLRLSGWLRHARIGRDR